jgi:inner membrane transporter RhtA
MLVISSGLIARLRSAGNAVHPLRMATGLPGSMPPSSLLVVGMITVQLGAALAKDLFGSLGPAGVVFLRVGFAALTLLAIWRPWRHYTSRKGVLAGATRANYFAVVLFGLILALMNFTFYSALTRIPLGIAVTIEFIGPLSVAIAGSRRALDVLWAVLAVGGILLLAPLGVLGTVQLDRLGLLLALGAGACWAIYILLTAHVGRAFPGGTGLSLAMTVGALALLPLGIAGAGSALLNPRLLLLGAGVALLSSVVPYSLEMAALRRISPSAFGVLMSLEPAIAALIGWLVLRETLDLRAIVALMLVTTAAAGATRAGAHTDKRNL